MSIIIGFIIGAVLGLTGAGGSIFAVPLLILLLGIAPSNAMGIALGAVLVSAGLGTIAQRKEVLWTPALLLAIFGASVSPIGKYTATQLNETLLVLGFAVVAIIIAIQMLRQALKQPEFASYVRANVPSETTQSKEALSCRLSPTGQFQMRPRCIGGLLIGGAIVGFASGLFGVGGGFLIIPLLLFLSAISMPKAIATSLAVITLVSGSGFVSHLLLEDGGNLEPIVNVLIGSMIGMLISQRFSRQLSGPKLQVIFAALLILVVLALAVQQVL